MKNKHKVLYTGLAVVTGALAVKGFKKLRKTSDREDTTRDCEETEDLESILQNAGDLVLELIRVEEDAVEDNKSKYAKHDNEPAHHYIVCGIEYDEEYGKQLIFLRRNDSNEVTHVALRDMGGKLHPVRKNKRYVSVDNDIICRIPMMLKFKEQSK